MAHPVPEAASVMATAAYRELVRRRRRTTWSLAATLFTLLMALTALTVFTDLLDAQVVPGLNGAIIAAYVLFFAPVGFAHVYVARAGAMDELARRALSEAAGESEERR